MRIKEKERLKPLLAGCLMALLLLLIPLSSAAANSRVAARVTAVQKPIGTEGRNAVFYYELKADDPAFPAPVQQKLAITGNGQANFEIEFGETGIYRYTLRQLPKETGSPASEGQSYAVEIYVVDTRENGTLSAVVLFFDKDGKKTDAVFEPLCPSPESPKTGEEGYFPGWLILPRGLLLFAVLVPGIYGARKKVYGR